MTPAKPDSEFLELLEALCSNELTEQQKARLEELVKADAELRRCYVHYLHMHICLRRVYEQAAPTSVPRIDPSRPTGFEAPTPAHPLLASRRNLRRFGALLAASILVVVGSGLAWLLSLPSGPNGNIGSVAVLTNAIGCAWETPQAPVPGSNLRSGRLELSAGVAEITCGGGAVVLVEAPAVLELIDGSHGFLHSGRVVIKVPPKATGFVMETRKARLLDQGTEFGVDVDTSGDTLVEVFDGVVMADCKDEGGQTQRVTAGQTVQIGGDRGAVRELASSPERFIRRFPSPTERGADWLVPYNQRRFDRVHIVPAPAAVKIDGDLSDWDRSGSFFIACEEPYSKHYYIEGAMMYDAKFLYIGAHVGDPAPMCSVIDPETDPKAGWKGGGVQVRLSTDRKAGWPLGGQWAALPGYQPHPLDKSEQLVHLTMWHCKPRDQACLHIAHGMNLHGDKINPPGYKAAYRKDADGRGYVLEYAIPWELLSAAQDPPLAGDVLGACWNVHWSDEEGRLWKGYLVDIINPAEKGYTYQRAATWGQAIYHPKGKLPPGTVMPR